MTETEIPFTMTFWQAMGIGIDYRDFKKVRKLPEGVAIAAIAGVWGDHENLRCLFITEDEQLLCRTGFFWTNYFIPEINKHGKEIKVGEQFIVSNCNDA